MDLFCVEVYINLNEARLEFSRDSIFTKTAWSFSLSGLVLCYRNRFGLGQTLDSSLWTASFTPQGPTRRNVHPMHISFLHKVMKAQALHSSQNTCHEVACQHRRPWLLMCLPPSFCIVYHVPMFIHKCNYEHHIDTRRRQGVPGQDEASSELQMNPKTELLLTDKWQVLFTSLSLSFRLTNIVLYILETLFSWSKAWISDSIALMLK